MRFTRIENDHFEPAQVLSFRGFLRDYLDRLADDLEQELVKQLTSDYFGSKRIAWCTHLSLEDRKWLLRAVVGIMEWRFVPIQKALIIRELGPMVAVYPNTISITHTDDRADPAIIRLDDVEGLAPVKLRLATEIVLQAQGGRFKQQAQSA